MPQDLLTLKSLQKELKSLLNGGKIQKINQPEKDEVRFVVYSGGTSYVLVASANPNTARIHIAYDKKENPYSAPAFCMLLRKHLLGATIKDISILNDDRVFKISLSARTEMQDVKDFFLIVELMGRYSNVILLDEKEIVLDAIVRIGVSEKGRRVIMPGVKYTPQSKGDKAELYDSNGIKTRLETSDKPTLYDALLSSVNGLSKQSAKEISWRANDAENPVEKAVQEITFLDDIFGKSAFKPCVLKDYSDFFVTPYLSLASENDFIFLPTLNGAVNACFTLSDKAQREKNYFKDVVVLTKRHRDKLLKKIEIAHEKLVECDDMENVRISAELLSNNLYKVNRGDASVTVENYYDDMRPLTINLDVTKTPGQNVQHLFNKYNKLKRAKEISHRQIEEYQKELDYVNSIIDALSRAELSDAENIKEELVALKIIKKQGGNQRKKSVVKSAPKTYEVDGFTIYVGTNNILNNEVTFKIGRSFDVWLHVKNHHGSHVIIRKNNENDAIPDSVLSSAAETAAYFSEASNSENVAVDYTERRNVRRIKDAGLGMVNYDDYKTIFVTPKNNLKK